MLVGTVVVMESNLHKRHSSQCCLSPASTQLRSSSTRRYEAHRCESIRDAVTNGSELLMFVRLQRWHSVVAAGLFTGVLLELLDVGGMCDGVDRQVHCECAESQSEAGEDVACEEAVRKDGVLAPCFALGPWITVELWHRCGYLRW